MSAREIYCNDLKISYDQFGPSTAPTLLLLHAGGESRQVWAPVIDKLSICRGSSGNLNNHPFPTTKNPWQIIAPDLRGHGDSDRADDYWFEDFVADTRRLIEQRCQHPLVIVGSSIGGLMGLMLAGCKQIAVDGLILLDAPTRLSPGATRRESQKVVDGIEAGVDVLAHLDPKLATGFLVDEILTNPGRLTKASQSVRAATLLLYGSRSKAIGEAELKAFAEDIPHGEAKAIDCGHLIARDRPELVAECIDEFLIQFERVRNEGIEL